VRNNFISRVRLPPPPPHVTHEGPHPRIHVHPSLSLRTLSLKCHTGSHSARGSVNPEEEAMWRPEGSRHVDYAETQGLFHGLPVHVSRVTAVWQSREEKTGEESMCKRAQARDRLRFGYTVMDKIERSGGATERARGGG